MDRPTVYACDPKKNRECRKTGCVYNRNAVVKQCSMTTNPAYAKLDENGEPIRIERPLTLEAKAFARIMEEALRKQLSGGS